MALRAEPASLGSSVQFGHKLRLFDTAFRDPRQLTSSSYSASERLIGCGGAMHTSGGVCPSGQQKERLKPCSLGLKLING
jgi:hypothetical protein